MNKFIGQNQFKFKVDTNWAKLPEGWTFKEVGGVGVDSKDRVYVFNRLEKTKSTICYGTPKMDFIYFKTDERN